MSQEIRVKGKAARVRGATWTHDQVEKLFEVWTQPNIYKGLLNEKKKQGIFRNMAATLTNLGVIRTWQECRAKIKNLKADFRKAMDKKIQFRYHDQMWKVLNMDGSATPTGRGASSSRSGGSTPTDSGSRWKSENDDDDERSDMDDEDLQPETITPTKTIVMPNEPSANEEVVVNVSVIKSPSSLSSFPVHTPTYYESHSVASSSYIEPEYITPSTPPTPKFTQRLQHSNSPQESRRHQAFEEDTEEHKHYVHHYNRHQQQEIRNEYEHDSSSRSSMIITHVVSNVIEPVTTVVMPSSNNFRNVVTPATPAPPSPEVVDPAPLSQPIRLEFVVDDDNLILQNTSTISKQISAPDNSESHQFQGETSHYQPSASVNSPPSTISPPRKSTQRPFSHSTLTPPKKRPLPPPSSESMKQRLKQKRTVPPPVTPNQREKTTPVEHGKKRKLLETLNKKTVETISTLLTETSQTLLKEIQDAEHRFILWEEEKRNDERRREEAMFSKLMHAMKAASLPKSSSTSENEKSGSKNEDDEEDDSAFITTFSGVSKRLNAMVNDEIKATEETLKQWEMKMQRQESRHSEKLFAMIINAIKTPTASQQD
ncbi:unnamed protein product [Orchesella dallaii]|uniref:Myb/SANT-like DNA-binding domain-containing protein n=1 Tax=Orchesella dallaii TaxID=48710 RepID=A0ABP1RE57_9HEXA